MVKPSGLDQRAEPSPALNEGQTHAVGGSVWEQVLARPNLFAALKRVKQNGGAPGIDGMTVDELEAYLKAHGLEIRAQLDAGSYPPKPVRRQELPKPEGGVRLFSPWHMAASPVVHMALSNAYWQAQELHGITERYHQLRSA